MAIERQLDALATRAASGQPSKPDFNVFEWASDGSVLTVSRSDPTVTKALVSEWQAAASPRGAPAAALLGPVREGSEWLIAARAPLAHPTPGAGSHGRMDDRLRKSRSAAVSARAWCARWVSTMTSRWYGPIAGGGYAQAFVASGSGPLRDPVVTLIQAPPGFAFISPGALSSRFARMRVGIRRACSPPISAFSP